MRKCLRCGTTMVGGLSVMTYGYKIEVRTKGFLNSSLGHLRCAVCSTCGYAETYIKNPEKVKKLAEKDK